MRQRDLRIARGKDGSIRDGLLQQLLIVFFGCDIALQEDVRVRVNKSGQDRGLGEINDFYASRNISPRRDGYNLISLNQDERILDRLVALSINQFARSDCNPMRTLRGGKQSQNQIQKNCGNNAAHEDFLPQGRKAYQSCGKSSPHMALLRETGAAAQEKTVETSTTARASANITPGGPQALPFFDVRPADRKTDNEIMHPCGRVPASVQVCFIGHEIWKPAFREDM
jgi:hypothetical protein